MKKSLVLMAMAGVALASCVNEVADVVQKEQVKLKIAFDAPVMYDNANSRANAYGELGPEVDGETYRYPQAEKIIVYAVQHTDPLTSWTAEGNDTKWGFSGDSISYNSSFHAWVPVKDNGEYYYWPNGYLSFAATSPGVFNKPNESVVREYSATGLSIGNYDFIYGAHSDDNVRYKEQVDILYSNRVLNQSQRNNSNQDTSSPSTSYNGIPLQFKHALSSVRFEIKNDLAQSVNVTLTSIQIEDVYTKGSFNEQYNEDTNLASPVWTPDGTTGFYQAFVGELLFPYSERRVSVYSKEVSATNHAYNLLLMPQTFTADSKIVVKYTIGDSDDELIKEIFFNNADKEINLSQTAWECGTRYTYLIKYSEGSQVDDMIYFAPNVNGWVNAEKITIEL